MKLVSPFLKRVVYPGLSRAGYLRHRAGGGPAIVTYHGVLPSSYRVRDRALDGSLVDATSLRRQIRLLKRNYQVISPAEFRSWCENMQELPRRAVLLTCDDGLQNAVTDMLPVLQECSVQCLFFITSLSLQDSSFMLWYEELYLMLMSVHTSLRFQLSEFGLDVALDSDSKNGQWWELVKQLSRFDHVMREKILQQIKVELNLDDSWKATYIDNPAAARRFGLLTVSQVRQLLAAGMTVGAHSVSHPVLSQADDKLAQDEVLQSRIRLQDETGQEVWAFAYPFGDPASVGARDLQLAEQAGFSCAFMNAGGGFGTELPRYALPRVHVTREMSLAEFEAHVSGFYRSLRQRFAGRGESLAISAQGAQG